MVTIAETIPLLSSLAVLGLNIVVFGAVLSRKNRKHLKRTPKVSIIVTAWNEGPRIERCIKSLLNLNYPKKNLEIIVIGGGTDNTAKVCRKLTRKGLIRFFEEKKRSGKWSALNRGVEKARYDHLAFTDADCVLGKEWLKSLVSYDKTDIVVSPAIALHEKGHIGKCFSVAHAYLSLISYGSVRALKTSAFSGVGSFMKKSLVKKLKFEKSYVEDYRFCQRAINKGYKIEIALDAPSYSGQPETFNDWRKSYLRIFYGLASEMVFLKDKAIIIFISIGVLSLLGGIFSVLTNHVLIDLLLSINLGLVAISILNVILVSRMHKTNKYIFRIPYLALFYIFVQLIAIEGIFKWLLRRNVEWEIYNKT